MAVTSSASSLDRGGRRPGRRRASMVLPAPGGPIIRRLCAPAAAISRARRAPACPLTSARSSIGPDSGARDGEVARGSATPWLSASSNSASEPTVLTSSPSTSPASAALARGTTARCSPRSRAPSSWGSTPRSGCTVPSSDSSPTKSVPSSDSRGTAPSAPSVAAAMARSNPLPVFFTSAGARLTTIWHSEMYSPTCASALFTRTRLSRTDASARPTSSKKGGPRRAATSTRTRCAWRPTRVALNAVASMG